MSEQENEPGRITQFYQPREYRYKPLPQGEFLRLLAILPSPIDDFPLVCSMCHCPLAQAERKYEAISYTWGDATPTNAILIDGKIAHVRDNLWQAIKHIRLIDEIRVVWVDALCINQADLAERASQVAQMGTVYSNAASVVVWLGNGNSATDHAMDSLNDLLREVLQSARKNQHKSDFMNRLKDIFRSWVSREPDNATDGLLQGLFSIFEFPWWTRVWTFQEFAFADEVTMCCGTRCLDWLALLQFFMLAKIYAVENPVDCNLEC